MKKLLNLVLCAALSLCCLACEKKVVGRNEAFDQYLEDSFIEMLESSYLNLHTFVEDPSTVGIDLAKIDVKIEEPFTETMYEEDRKELKESIEELNAFDYDSLDADQKVIYDQLKWESDLALQLADEKFDYYYQPFASMMGIHSQLPILFSDYQFYNEDDLKCFIKMMEQTKELIDSYILHGEIQLEKELVMIDTTSVIEYCEGVIEPGENSSILKAINNNIDALALDEKTSNQYKEEVKTAFMNAFIPAYENIVSYVEKVEASGKNNELGYSQFEYGNEYYQLNVQLASGSTKSFEEITAFVEEGLEDGMKSLTTLAIVNQEALQKLMDGETPTTNYTSYEEMIEDMKDKMKDDFPVVKDHEYVIFDMDKEVASDGVGAYFNIPAIDSTKPRQMRVNPNSATDISAFSTFNTIAHEGMPGHMYHYNFLYNNLKTNFEKVCMENDALTEGYAVYAAQHTVNYLDDVDTGFIKLYQSNEILTYYMILLADFNIHTNNWTEEDLADYIGTDEGIDLLYDQLQANPAAFVPYYVGYLQIDNLLNKAKKALDDNFNHQAFIQALLEKGKVNFELIEANIDAYIEANK